MKTTKQQGSTPIAVVRNDPPYIEINRGEELRCPICGKLILKGELGAGGRIEHKCQRCKTMCRFESL